MNKSGTSSGTSNRIITLPGHRNPLDYLVEVSERLVGSPAFKAGVRGDPS